MLSSWHLRWYCSTMPKIILIFYSSFFLSYLSLCPSLSLTLSSLSPSSLSHFLRYCMALSITHHIEAFARTLILLETGNTNSVETTATVSAASVWKSPMQGLKTRRRGFRSVIAIEFVQIASARSDTSRSLRDDVIG